MKPRPTIQFSSVFNSVLLSQLQSGTQRIGERGKNKKKKKKEVGETIP